MRLKQLPLSDFQSCVRVARTVSYWQHTGDRVSAVLTAPPLMQELPLCTVCLKTQGYSPTTRNQPWGKVWATWKSQNNRARRTFTWHNNAYSDLWPPSFRLLDKIHGFLNKNIYLISTANAATRLYGKLHDVVSFHLQNIKLVIRNYLLFVSVKKHSDLWKWNTDAVMSWLRYFPSLS